MAEEKKKKIVTKVTNSVTSDNVNIENQLNNMAKLSLDNFANGRMKMVLKKEAGVIKKDILDITGDITAAQKDFAIKIQGIAAAEMDGVSDGECIVVFDAELTIS